MTEDRVTQAEVGRERVREEVARRINAQSFSWETKVAIWEAEMSESETTFAKVLKRCGEHVPE